MNRDRFGYMYLLVTVVLFSTYEVVSKTLVGLVDPFQINFIRFFSGGLVLLLFTAMKRDIRITLKDCLWLTGIGITNVVISMNLLQLSLYVENAKASVAAVMFSSNPIFVAVFAALIEKEKITLRKITGLVIGFSGIIVIFLEKLQGGISDFKSPMLALLSAIFYGLYTVMGRRVSVRIGSLKMNSYSFIAGSLLLLPILLLLQRPVLEFHSSAILRIIYLSIMVTGVAYLCYFKGLSTVGASKGSLVFFIKPVLAGIIAIVFLSEKASINLLAGTLMIVAGISVILHKSQNFAKKNISFEGFLKNKENK